MTTKLSLAQIKLALTNIMLSTIVLLMVFSLLNIVYIPVVNAETLEKKQSVYPTTPEGVVKAYVNADFNGTGNEIIGDINNRLKYTDGHINVGSDCFPIATKYKISKLKQSSKEASVEVRYEIIGEICGDDSLELNKRNEKTIYSLDKINGLWKISFPDEAPRISIITAIKILKRGHPLPLKNKKIETNINKLNELLTNNIGGKQ